MTSDKTSRRDVHVSDIAALRQPADNLVSADEVGAAVGFTRDDLRGFRGGTLPDLAPRNTRLLMVGINPGL